METTSRKQVLLKAIYERLEQVYEDTLEDVLELLNISDREDAEDIADAVAELEAAKVNGTISWENYQKELQKSKLCVIK
ncbi:hypothetical protein MEN41_21845 [Dolichospermum sp. ST_con]|nr:hypothetical protein [Dolichospermum sp. ST_con]MDD1417985.1 hypothetical protein [Dolichospermum sp. ST_sed1]MDD1423531.1 hypothetical protein [Dolichospermum sp. ST_sed9]MDD1432289.1 hypothetical protein [Dolichospermum sp. ST_sed6]MDD1436525.1 hypothetical protein [Dolichospermum sp. ST_sed10]MDD1438994.1 hypothetical protein [Dolichospermum sp. ST_sed3]MDD1445301.1 hypothetical protein [Dolichospermum sp. ST_sed8]MDD1454049.1 hypothetical protein [Dolichospermum sp. ST_sed7]MDD146027